ncbi:hypothetical protein FisN_14Hh379 [Fistulifera solaris]|jgi:F-box/WD-40 domain protein 7|uniref:U-box domain-containing protein n=1 Tax=Fistulifera solaris TaxID=1519565 RepID=A0A1Z5K5A7_FISSO|nr:hypothetical protein FisN_14Hh379 [Fistulifera solaris]|eukprot:GAX21168.1 hypothetical protein FisN_14Hh379 [Fistulifera solaris]
MSSLTVLEHDEMITPSHFLCPISQCIMMHPVMTRSGHNYERKAILKWLKEKNNTCPMTRNILTVKDLVSNRALRSVIQAWCVANNVSQETLDDEEDDSEILLTCSISQLKNERKSSNAVQKHSYDDIIDRAWKKRAELRKIPNFQHAHSLRR